MPRATKRARKPSAKALERSKRKAEIRAERWTKARQVVREFVEARVIEYVEDLDQGVLDLQRDPELCDVLLLSDRDVKTVMGAELPDLEELILIIPHYDPRVQAGDTWFDEEAAQEAVDWFPDCCTHIEGEWAGHPLDLEPWQRAVIANAFGWKRPDGSRRYREVWLEVARKNGKSPVAAGVALKLTGADGEPGAQVYSAAGDREQAAIIHRHAAGMVHNDEDLGELFVVYKVGKSIEYRRTGSILKALSREGKTKHGLNVHGLIVDEVHVQEDRKLLGPLTTASSTRRQPMFWWLTTADFERESPCNDLEDYALKVRANIIEDPEFLPVIYRADPEDPWDKPATWRKANPNLGVSVKLRELERAARKAKHNPRELLDFKRLHLNLKTSQLSAWVNMDRWRACPGPQLVAGDYEAFIDELGLEGLPCFGGLDLADTKDLAAFYLYWPDVHAALGTFWAPMEAAETREEDQRQRYLPWAEEGWLELVEGSVNDTDLVVATVLEAWERFHVQEVAYDRFGAIAIAKTLAENGVRLLKHGQGSASMNEPSRLLEGLWLERKLLHGHHPVLTWNASNAVVQTTTTDLIRPNKAKSKDRIDGLVALVMAVGSSILGDGASVYETRGLARL